MAFDVLADDDLGFLHGLESSPDNEATPGLLYDGGEAVECKNALLFQVEQLNENTKHA